MPNSVYNWYCVFHSLGTIARHAAAIRMGSPYPPLPLATREYLDSETGRQQTQTQVEKQTVQPSKFHKTPETPGNNEIRPTPSGGAPTQAPIASTLEDTNPFLRQADANSTVRIIPEPPEVMSVPKMPLNSTAAVSASAILCKNYVLKPMPLVK